MNRACCFQYAKREEQLQFRRSRPLPGIWSNTAKQTFAPQAPLPDQLLPFHCRCIKWNHIYVYGNQPNNKGQANIEPTSLIYGAVAAPAQRYSCSIRSRYWNTVEWADVWYEHLQLSLTFRQGPYMRTTPTFISTAATDLLTTRLRTKEVGNGVSNTSGIL